MMVLTRSARAPRAFGEALLRSFKLVKTKRGLVWHKKSTSNGSSSLSPLNHERISERIWLTLTASWSKSTTCHHQKKNPSSWSSSSKVKINQLNRISLSPPYEDQPVGVRPSSAHGPSSHQHVFSDSPESSSWESVSVVDAARFGEAREGAQRHPLD